MLLSPSPILALVLATTLPAPPPSLVLTCDMGPPPGAPTAPSVVRTFRIAPGSFQEWRPAAGQFGNNLCLSFPCAREHGRFRGVIRSASLEVTIEADPVAGVGAWKALGASGHTRSNGACRVQAESAWRASAR